MLQGTVDFTISPFDNIGVKSVELFLDGKKLKKIDNWDFKEKETVTVSIGKLLNKRVHTLTVKVCDFANKETTVQKDVKRPFPYTSKLVPNGSDYRTPYTMAYTTFTIPETEEVATGAEESNLVNSEDTTITKADSLIVAPESSSTTDADIPGLPSGLQTTTPSAIEETAEQLQLEETANTSEEASVKETVADVTNTDSTITDTTDVTDITAEPSTDWQTADLPLHPLADEFHLTQTDRQTGTLAAGATSDSFSFEVGSGTDYALLSDDWLGDFSLEITDPAGHSYYAGQRYENLNVAEDDIQAVLNLGTQGALLFHGMPGTWSYRVINHGEEASYDVGLYTQLAAPLLDNPDTLLNLTDGSFTVSGTAGVQPGATI